MRGARCYDVLGGCCQILDANYFIMSEPNSKDMRAHPSGSAVLLAIVEVAESERVRCARPGCQKTVYKAVHIVRDGGQLMVLGSKCFAKLYGGLMALGQAYYSAGTGKVLTTEERQMLQENTEALLARFEAAEALARQAEALRLERLREAQQLALERTRALEPAPYRSPPPAPQWTHAQGRPLPTRSKFPWHWMKPGTSVAAFKLRDGTGWVRVEHQDGRQFITPWPSFEGWEEALPALVGRPDMAVGAYEILAGVPPVLNYLRTLTENGERGEKRTGLWSDVVALLGSGPGPRSTPA